jgi:hypothetical protein
MYLVLAARRRSLAEREEHPFYSTTLGVYLNGIVFTFPLAQLRLYPSDRPQLPRKAIGAHPFAPPKPFSS